MLDGGVGCLDQVGVLRKKSIQGLIARFRPAMLDCFVPVDPTTPPAS